MLVVVISLCSLDKQSQFTLNVFLTGENRVLNPGVSIILSFCEEAFWMSISFNATLKYILLYHII